MTIREMAENFTEPAAMDDIQVKKTKPYTVYKMTIREMAENFTEPAATDDIQVKKTKPYTVYHSLFDSFIQ